VAISRLFPGPFQKTSRWVDLPEEGLGALFVQESGSHLGRRGENPRALILAPFDRSHLAALSQTIEVSHESWMDTRRLYDPEELASRLRDEDIPILVVEADFVFEEVFQGAPSLRFVGICRSSTSQVDLDAATLHGVLVVNTPGRNAQAVAEHALGLMLSLARRIPTAHRYITDGRWRDPVEPYLSMRGIELAGRTIGLIGLGAIGRRLASMASALGMKPLAYDPYASGAPVGVRLTDLDSLLAEADFVSVHVPHTPETEGLIDARRLGLMKATAYLVNLSDAAIIEEEALVAALREQRIAGAALDVFETHPIMPTSPLLSLDNVVLTPHLGGATEETIERHSKLMAEEIQRFLQGQRPKNLVNPEAWSPGD
jgi:phosphoglycerate dehydrogenase-like enzyme